MTWQRLCGFATLACGFFLAASVGDPKFVTAAGLATAGIGLAL